MKRAVTLVAIGILVGLAIVWLVLSSTPPQQDTPLMNGIRRPNVPPSR